MVKVNGRAKKLETKSSTLYSPMGFKKTALTCNNHDIFNEENFESDQEPITTKTYSSPMKDN